MIKYKANDKRFKFGVDKSPWWFIKKVQSMDIEYITKNHKVIGCRFYHIYTNKEKIIYIGQIVTMNMLYANEPERIRGKRKYKR